MAKATANKIRPAFSYLVCPDSQLLRIHIEEETKQFFPQQDTWERFAYWGEAGEEPPRAFWEHLTLQGLLGKNRFVVVHRANMWPAEIWKKIDRVLASPSSQCWPFFCLENTWEKQKPKLPVYFTKLKSLAYAEQQGWVWRNPGLTEKSMRQYVQQRLATLHLNMSRETLDNFCAFLQPDALSIENELQKWYLLQTSNADAQKVFKEQMNLSVQNQDSNLFNCVRYLEDGNLVTLFWELNKSRETEKNFFQLSALLDREIRLLWRIQHGEDVYLHPVFAQSKKNLARTLSAETLGQAMALLIDAEYKIKSGILSVEQSLAFLVTQLACIFKKKT